MVVKSICGILSSLSSKMYFISLYHRKIDRANVIDEKDPPLYTTILVREFPDQLVPF